MPNFIIGVCACGHEYHTHDYFWGKCWVKDCECEKFKGVIEMDKVNDDYVLLGGVLMCISFWICVGLAVGGLIWG